MKEHEAQNTTSKTMPAASWMMLKNCLNVGGWATAHVDVHVAGKLDYEDRIKIEQLPEDANKATAETWAKELLTFAFSDKELQTIRKCLDYNVGKGNLFANRYSSELLGQFTSFE